MQGYIDYDGVDSCDDSESDIALLKADDYCYKLNFTLQEILTINQCVDNALEYYKECLDEPSYSNDTKGKIKASSVKARNLQAKLVSFTKHIR